MNTTAQQDFQAFLNKQSSPDYNISAMTDAEIIAENITYTKLKVAANQEIEANKIEEQTIRDEQQAAFNLQQQQAKEAYIESLKSKGFKCDNSLSDYKNLFSLMKIGDAANQQRLAQDNFDLASEQNQYPDGIEHFLQLCRQFGI